MDLQMPVMDGITATSIIREKHKLDTPIIAQTANTVQKDIDKCFEVGFSDYLPKPFSNDELIHKIGSTLQLKMIPKANLTTDKTSKSTIIENVLNLVDHDIMNAIEILEAYHQEMPINLQKINTAIQHKNLDELSKIGHAIKSTFKLFKMIDAHEIALSFENLMEHEVDYDKEFEKYRKLELIFQKSDKHVMAFLMEKSSV